MVRNKPIRLAFFAIVASQLLLTACTGGAATPLAPPVRPTILVTQVIVQITATPLPTDTPSPPTPTPVPTSTPLWDPFSVPIYFPLMNCIASRLHEKDTAFVSWAAGIVGVYVSRDIPWAPLKRYAQPGELFFINRGPWCVDGVLMWKVFDADGEEGFVPEGDGNTYFLLPAPPWVKLKAPKNR